MSHITDVSKACTILCLDSLAEAVERFCPTLEIVTKTHYRTWKDDHAGRLVGDWPLPTGWTAAMVGEGAFGVIRMKEEALHGELRTGAFAPYEIGVVPVKVTRDETGNILSAVPDMASNEYMLMTDWYNHGNGILQEPGVGTRGSKGEPFHDLLMYYSLCAELQQARALGEDAQIEQLENGEYVMTVETERAHA